MESWCSASWHLLRRAARKHRQTSCSHPSAVRAELAFYSSLHDSDPGYLRTQSAALAVLEECPPCAGPSLPFQPSRLFVRLRPSDHFSAMGVISVVMMTMITTAPKIAELITGSLTPLAFGNINVAPMPAKISPTSPRGIIPSPTARRFSPRSTTPSE